MFEALSWAGSLEERMRDRREPLLEAIRLVRNSVTHQWAEALTDRDVPNPAGTLVVRGGGGSRIVGPPTVVEWFWRPFEELPIPPAATHRRRFEARRAHYVAVLAGRPAGETLVELGRLFAA